MKDTGIFLIRSAAQLVLTTLIPANLLLAQFASVGVKSETPHLEGHSVPHVPDTSRAAAPVAGYLLGPGAADIHSISTLSKSVRLGEAVAVPAATRKLYLPPRQQYALVEQTSAEPVAVWGFHTPEVTVINGAMAHPDAVIFSPRGESMLLYSQASSSLQVVTHLPAEPTVLGSHSLPFPAFRTLAVSDDGAVVAALFADGSIVHSSSDHSNWSTLHTRFSAQVLSFLPKTHALGIVDAGQKLLVQLSNIESSAGVSDRILAQDIQADQLLATRGGEEILAANTALGQLWTIDLKTGAVSQEQSAGKINSLLSLRDGYTFLLSTQQGLSFLRLTDGLRLAEATH